MHFAASKQSPVLFQVLTPDYTPEKNTLGGAKYCSSSIGSRRTKSADFVDCFCLGRPAWIDCSCLARPRAREKSLNPIWLPQRPPQPSQSWPASAASSFYIPDSRRSPESTRVETKTLKPPPCPRLISGWSRVRWVLRRIFFPWTTFWCPTRSSPCARRSPCRASALSS